MPPLLLSLKAQALLALADGTAFQGISIGAPGHTVGEVVFNTALTGYQEILTDPSYCRQIVTLTYPHIGSYGISADDVEAKKVFAAGLVIKDLSLLASNFRSSMTLAEYLKREGTVAIANIDTRRLTRVLRTAGAQNGCILTLPLGEAITPAHIAEAIAKAKAAPSMSGLDLAKVVSEREPYEWTETEWALETGYGTLKAPKFHVVAYDFGVKRNILRMLASRGCKVTVVPAQTPAAEVLKHKPDGIFLSNGPGDPEPVAYAIDAIKRLLESGVPIFGICLGHQLLGLALGGKTFKLKFGHHGANHPVKDLATGKIEITSQNHGFCVDIDSLPKEVRTTHVNLNDGTSEGMAHATLPVFSVQHHPEASAGPHDSRYLFERFRAKILERKETSLA